MGWNIGANDAANCIGASVGSGILSFRRAVALMILCMVAGAVLQGHYVMETVGKGIVLSDPESYDDGAMPEDHEEHFPEGRLPDAAIFVALLSGGLFVTLATCSRVPVSTSQAVVGGVLGVGIGMVGFDGAYFRLDVIWKILTCWLVSPFLTLILAFLIYGFLGRIVRRLNAMALWNRVVGILVVLSACYVSYSLGMNNVGNAVGPLLSRFPEHGTRLAIASGAAIALGAATFGRRVTETVGKGITPLDLTGALAAQVASASGIYLFSIMGIPVSTSTAIVGAVIGVGLVRGSRAVSGKKVLFIAAGWVGSPLCAALFAAAVTRLLVLHVI